MPLTSQVAVAACIASGAFTWSTARDSAITAAGVAVGREGLEYRRCVGRVIGNTSVVGFVDGSPGVLGRCAAISAIASGLLVTVVIRALGRAVREHARLTERTDHWPTRVVCASSILASEPDRAIDFGARIGLAFASFAALTAVALGLGAGVGDANAVETPFAERAGDVSAGRDAGAVAAECALVALDHRARIVFTLPTDESVT